MLLLLLGSKWNMGLLFPNFSFQQSARRKLPRQEMFREKQSYPAYLNSDNGIVHKYLAIFNENIPQEIKSLLSYKEKKHTQVMTWWKCRTLLCMALLYFIFYLFSYTLYPNSIFLSSLLLVPHNCTSDLFLCLPSEKHRSHRNINQTWFNTL